MMRAASALLVVTLAALSFASAGHAASIDYDPQAAQRSEVLREAQNNMLRCAWGAPRSAVAAGSRDQDQIVAFAIIACGTSYKKLAPQFGGAESDDVINARIEQAALESLRRMPGVTLPPATASAGGMSKWVAPPPLRKLTLRAEQAGKELGWCLRDATKKGTYPFLDEEATSRSIKRLLGEQCDSTSRRWVRECAGAGNTVTVCVSHMTFAAHELIITAAN